MVDKSHPIGVFDSGMGGLTVLRSLKAVLPHESFLYLGDTARLPYGTKSILTVQNYATQMAQALIKRQIKALVIACNTATTAALPHLQAQFPDLPIIGVLEPGANAAVKHTKNGRIFLLATETTIASGGYQKLILEKLPEAKLNTRAANLLVAIAEEGMPEHTVALEALKYYLSSFQDEDTLLLACTHFPIFKPIIQTLLPQVTLVDSAETTALALQETLSQCNLLNPNASQTIQYLVTDSIQRFRQVGQIFLGEPLDDANIELVDA